MPTKVTIDSNLINLKQKIESVNKLEALHKARQIKIVGAERLYDEMRNFKPEAYNKASNYENIGEPFVIGCSRIEHAYISSDDPNLPDFKELSYILFPNIELEKLTDNQINDIMHLLAHSHSNSEYFITNNRNDFIDGKKSNANRTVSLGNITREKLKEKSIKVITSGEAVELFDLKK